MGDTGGSGVAGVFVVIGIFAVTILLGLGFLILSLGKSSNPHGQVDPAQTDSEEDSRPAIVPERDRSDYRLLLGVLLTPLLIFCGWFLFEVAKASIESTLHRIQDEHRARPHQESRN
jgi:hypothetical protein